MSPLRVGQEAPDFDALASDGRRVRLSELRGKKRVVLYFYPRDFTRVCTAEACGFRELYPDLAAADTEVIGVSLDSDASHRKFAEAHNLPFLLLADRDGQIAKRYGATSTLRGLLGLAKRVTYVIGRDGTIAGVFEAELSATPHLEGVRRLLAILP